MHFRGVHWIIGGDGRPCQWRLSWVKVSGRGPFVYSSSPHHRLYHPLTCRPSRRPTRRRRACPGCLLSAQHPSHVGDVVAASVRAPRPESNIPKTWNKIFRDDGEKGFSSAFYHARETCTSSGCGAQVSMGPQVAFAGEERQTCESNLARRTAHVRPRRSREAIEPRRRRFGGRGPRGSVETSLTRCQLWGPS